MTTQTLNSLSKASSAYLRSAMHQPIQWNEWGEEAFAIAKRENKPILLDIGAVWCHWCHVMDRESYDDPEVAKIVNERFVAVKVDRDERPDIDSRYQVAVSAVSGQGGWPLTAFLTPDGKPFFGGTYFPPEDAMGRPGFSVFSSAFPKHFAINAQTSTTPLAHSKKPSPRLSCTTPRAVRSIPASLTRSLNPHCASSTNSTAVLAPPRNFRTQARSI